ncbi:MAG TPA: magnesium/cobalt transporter CorA [Anaerolineales bacterium]|nr:magnesium/cobalt transporter CorA [Anaerolineales bacterium]
MKTQFKRAEILPGTAPGIEHDEIIDLPGRNERAMITCIDYSPSNAAIQEVNDLEEFLTQHRPEWSAVRWISVVGLSDMNAIHALATKYDLHSLAVEDVLHARQHPKVESYGGEESEFLARLFIVTRMLHIQDGSLRHEQLSIFLGHKTVLTLQEGHGEDWDFIRQRIKAKGSRLRGNDASFLAYSLLDAVVDSCFPILEHYSDRAEELESLILENSKPKLLNEIHQLKRDLRLLRWVMWPMREVVQALQRDPHECLSDTTRVYLRDLYDHVVQIIEIIETYREIASDLTDTYISSVSNRMNEVMKVLTLIGTIFIPLTFLAGVYGMNFHYMPELDMRWAYPAFWLLCALLIIVMLLFFRRRNWL